MRVKNLILYKNFEQDEMIEKMRWLMAYFTEEAYEEKQKVDVFYQCIGTLLEFATEQKMSGNIWKGYLTYLLINDENPYSKGCEIQGIVEGTLNEAVIHDFNLFKELFDYDFSHMRERLQVFAVDMILEFKQFHDRDGNQGLGEETGFCELVDSLGKSGSPAEMKEKVTVFYQEFGVGKFGLHKAFRVEHLEKGVDLIPIHYTDPVHLSDLIGYDIPKRKLIDNTEAFLEGRRANNCLLFGDAGTGKSSSVKALLNEYYDRGLRIIELYKHQFKDLNDVIGLIRNRNYRFIIYMDDLSFEDFEVEYKYLKAVIEGGLESKPDNVLLYATSNRRHLIREKFSDKEGRREDLHASDTVQEKLSLSARFGVNIFFCAPDKKEFQQIVKLLAIKNHIQMDEEKLLLEANKWELSHGGLSGRTAQQFILYLLSQNY